ncbi:aminodeoxychorismate lyase [Neptunomonas antarctica]|uniref:Aminodeoxychorismate lyase n=1 Tax=Neptunomonas antarctica TaxID=619304 RepID=A0A1N7PJ83_9GAMM|nr:aminodeoxychorismate lyase [Neptunomonas antarctica]SIT10713.1 aminodeoxychorismate lyase apoprotein [Neptunomonas antarctica]
MNQIIQELTRVNGQASQILAITDRGLCYGDGLFETIKVCSNKPLLWDAHFSRLELGCKRLGIPFGGLKDRFDADLKALLPLNSHDTAVLKLTVTRGSGPRGYFPSKALRPTTISSLTAATDFSRKAAEGVILRWCDTPLSINPLLAGIKHLNRLEQVLARGEWENTDIAEGLMRDPDGCLIEGTMSNLFWCSAGVLYTPDIDRCGVAGVMRATLLALALKHQIPVVVGRFMPDVLNEADEVFICNSLIDIWPVIRLDGLTWEIGPVTGQLQTLLKEENSV